MYMLIYRQTKGLNVVRLGPNLIEERKLSNDPEVVHNLATTCTESNSHVKALNSKKECELNVSSNWLQFGFLEIRGSFNSDRDKKLSYEK